jgi:release factor glutamine methyltransferase
VNEPTWTIRTVLEWTTRDFAARGIDSARLDAELLVAAALGIERVGLYLDLDRPLAESERSAIRALVSRRREREPVAYILGYRDFYGRRFSVNRSVLIPRPDTETLVEQVLSCVPEDRPCRVLDLGTGSGIIAITVAAERPLAQVTATDLSEDALSLARTNAAFHEVSERVSFELVDLCGSGSAYDVIASNPPYIETAVIAGLQPEVRVHEPVLALDGGADGLDVIRRMLVELASVCEPGGQLLMEIGLGQATALRKLLAEHPAWELVAVHPDMGRIERVVQVRRA